MGHGTLTTGKILRSGYLGNGCHGDEKTFSILKYSIDWGEKVPGRSIMNGRKKPDIPVAMETNMLPWLQQKGCGSRQIKGLSAVNKFQFPDVQQQNKISVPIEQLVTMATIPSVKTDLQMAILVHHH